MKKEDVPKFKQQIKSLKYDDSILVETNQKINKMVLNKDKVNNQLTQENKKFEKLKEIERMKFEKMQKEFDHLENNVKLLDSQLEDLDKDEKV